MNCIIKAERGIDHAKEPPHEHSHWCGTCLVDHYGFHCPYHSERQGDASLRVVAYSSDHFLLQRAQPAIIKSADQWLAERPPTWSTLSLMGSQKVHTLGCPKREHTSAPCPLRAGTKSLEHDQPTSQISHMLWYGTAIVLWAPEIRTSCLSFDISPGVRLSLWILFGEKFGMSASLWPMASKRAAHFSFSACSLVEQRSAWSRLHSSCQTPLRCLAIRASQNCQSWLSTTRSRGDTLWLSQLTHPKSQLNSCGLKKSSFRNLQIDQNCSSMRSLSLKTSRTSLSPWICPSSKRSQQTPGAELTSIADTKAKLRAVSPLLLWRTPHQRRAVRESLKSNDQLSFEPCSISHEQMMNQRHRWKKSKMNKSKQQWNESLRASTRKWASETSSLERHPKFFFRTASIEPFQNNTFSTDPWIPQPLALGLPTWTGMCSEQETMKKNPACTKRVQRANSKERWGLTRNGGSTLQRLISTSQKHSPFFTISWTSGGQIQKAIHSRSTQRSIAEPYDSEMSWKSPSCRPLIFIWFLRTKGLRLWARRLLRTIQRTSIGDLNLLRRPSCCTTVLSPLNFLNESCWGSHAEWSIVSERTLFHRTSRRGKSIAQPWTPWLQATPGAVTDGSTELTGVAIATWTFGSPVKALNLSTPTWAAGTTDGPSVKGGLTTTSASMLASWLCRAKASFVTIDLPALNQGLSQIKWRLAGFDSTDTSRNPWACLIFCWSSCWCRPMSMDWSQLRHLQGLIRGFHSSKVFPAPLRVGDECRTWHPWNHKPRRWHFTHWAPCVQTVWSRQKSELKPIGIHPKGVRWAHRHKATFEMT